RTGRRRGFWDRTSAASPGVHSCCRPSSSRAPTPSPAAPRIRTATCRRKSPNPTTAAKTTAGGAVSPSMSPLSDVPRLPGGGPMAKESQLPMAFPAWLLLFLSAVAWSMPAGAQEADEAELGRKVFTSAQPACQVCHTLADAGASGRIGPDLDDLQPNVEQVRQVVRSGAGSMPSYADKLSEEEIDAVAEYVAQVAGG